MPSRSDSEPAASFSNLEVALESQCIFIFMYIVFCISCNLGAGLSRTKCIFIGFICGFMYIVTSEPD